MGKFKENAVNRAGGKRHRLFDLGFRQFLIRRPTAAATRTTAAATMYMLE